MGLPTSMLDPSKACRTAIYTWAGRYDEDFCRFVTFTGALLGVTGCPHPYFTRDSVYFFATSPMSIRWNYWIVVETGKARRLVTSQFKHDPMEPGPHTTITARVNNIIESAGPKGHIFNLGHGCTPETPISGVQAVVDAVHRWSW